MTVYTVDISEGLASTIIILVHIQPQCEMSVFWRLMTGILTKKKWQCPVLHIHLATGPFHERVDGEVSRHTY